MENLNSVQLEMLENNIKLLSEGMTLQKFLEIEEQLKINGSTEIYNNYGCYVIYNKTRDLYTIAGGPVGFSMSTEIHMFFVSRDGRGNPYMHMHYLANDEMILKFHRAEIDVNNVERYYDFQRSVENEYALTGESYFNYIDRVGYTEEAKEFLKCEKEEQQKSFATEENKESFATKLLKLQHSNKTLYNVLSLLADVLIKPLALTLVMLLVNRNWMIGNNPLQNIVLFVAFAVSSYKFSVIIYVVFLIAVQIFKLLFCKYKKVDRKFKIFDLIIKATYKNSHNNEEKSLCVEHKQEKVERKEKRQKDTALAEDKKIAKIEKNIEFWEKEYQTYSDRYEKSSYNAERLSRKLREKDYAFRSEESIREEAEKLSKDAEYFKSKMDESEIQIETLKRKVNSLKKKKE